MSSFVADSRRIYAPEQRTIRLYTRAVQLPRYKSARCQRALAKNTISSPRANILRTALARLRVTQEPQPEEPTAAQPQKDMAAILGDDPLAHTCGFLDARELDVLRTCGRRTRDVAGRGSVWEPVCARRWSGRRQLNEW